MKMSSPNCSVEMSSHGDMGDRHDESQGGPPAGPGAVGRGRDRSPRPRGPTALKMSPRQFRRLKARYRAEGVRGLVHRRRGQPSPRAPGRRDPRPRGWSWSRPRTATSMTATAPRSSGRSKACAVSREHRPPPPAGPRPAAQASAPAPASTAPAARATRPWAALVLVDGSQFDWLGTGTQPAPPRRHRRRDEHRRGPALPPRRRPARLSHPAATSSPRGTGCP